jgi:hypothetical protein
MFGATKMDARGDIKWGGSGQYLKMDIKVFFKSSDIIYNQKWG